MINRRKKNGGESKRVKEKEKGRRSWRLSEVSETNQDKETKREGKSETVRDKASTKLM